MGLLQAAAPPTAATQPPAMASARRFQLPIRPGRHGNSSNGHGGRNRQRDTAATTTTTTTTPSPVEAWLADRGDASEYAQFERHFEAGEPADCRWLAEAPQCRRWAAAAPPGQGAMLWVDQDNSALAAAMVEHLRQTEQLPVLAVFFRREVAPPTPLSLAKELCAQLLPHCGALGALLRPIARSAAPTVAVREGGSSGGEDKSEGEKDKQEDEKDKSEDMKDKHKDKHKNDKDKVKNKEKNEGQDDDINDKDSSVKNSSKPGDDIPLAVLWECLAEGLSYCRGGAFVVVDALRDAPEPLARAMSECLRSLADAAARGGGGVKVLLVGSGCGKLTGSLERRTRLRVTKVDAEQLEATGTPVAKGLKGGKGEGGGRREGDTFSPSALEGPKSTLDTLQTLLFGKEQEEFSKTLGSKAAQEGTHEASTASASLQTAARTFRRHGTEMVRGQLVRLLLKRGLGHGQGAGGGGSDGDPAGSGASLARRSPLHLFFAHVACPVSSLEVFFEFADDPDGPDWNAVESSGSSSSSGGTTGKRRTVFLAACAMVVLDSVYMLPGSAMFTPEETWRRATGAWLRMLTQKADPTAVDADGRNALHILLSNESMCEDHILTFLATRPAEARSLAAARDRKGWTPLHCALAVLRPRSCEALLAVLGDDNTAGRRGWGEATPPLLLRKDPEGAFALHRIAAQWWLPEPENRSGVIAPSVGGAEPHHHGNGSNESSHGGNQRYHNQQETAASAASAEAEARKLRLWRRVLALGGSLGVRNAHGRPPLFDFLAAATPVTLSPPSSSSNRRQQEWGRERELGSRHTGLDAVRFGFGGGHAGGNAGDNKGRDSGEDDEYDNDDGAMATRYLETLDLLFEAYSADLGARDDAGQTALHVVAGRGNHRPVEGEGGKPEQTGDNDNGDGGSSAGDNDGVDVTLFAYLVERGLDPRARDVEGQSPLDIAREAGKQSIVSMFGDGE